VHDELLRVVRWKMGRGVWRANNLPLAAGNAPEAVQACTAEALALVGAVPVPMVVQAGAQAVSTGGIPASGATMAAALLAPVRMLAKLRGIGPATVSAVLAAVYPERYPFLDDAVAAQVPELGPPAFTPRYYAAYAAMLRARAAELAARCPDSGWTPHATSSVSA
jgi:hypothetical protein